ncbi:RPL23A, partial [Symbiodinium sp. KB8]
VSARRIQPGDVEVREAPTGPSRMQEMGATPAVERPKPAEQISTKEPQQEDRQTETHEESQSLETDLDSRLDERSVLPASPFRGYRERRRLGQLAKESWQAWQQEHGVTLGQLQRATIPRQGSSLSGQHNTTNSTEPDQPVNPCFDEWPAADAARGSEASRTRDLLTHVGDGGRSSMQTGTDTSRESKPSIPQASNLQHPAQARRSPPSESKHSAYEALQRCEESLQGTQTQAKKHAEPAQTQTTPESTFVVHRGHKPMAKKAEKAAKAVKGTVSKKARKVRTKVRFYRPKTLIKARDPKYPRKSVESRGDKLDKYRIIQCPVTTESAMKKIEEINTLVFLVDLKATKPKIKEAVKQLYDVKCAKVNTLIRPDGKKKAYVRLTQDYDALDVANRIGII